LIERIIARISRAHVRDEIALRDQQRNVLVGLGAGW
jgi:hypothetical protein